MGLPGTTLHTLQSAEEAARNGDRIRATQIQSPEAHPHGYNDAWQRFASFGVEDLPSSEFVASRNVCGLL
jgi:hypothetical protein